MKLKDLSELLKTLHETEAEIAAIELTMSLPITAEQKEQARQKLDALVAKRDAFGSMSID